VAVVIGHGEIVAITCWLQSTQSTYTSVFNGPCPCCQKNDDCSGLSVSL